MRAGKNAPHPVVEFQAAVGNAARRVAGVSSLMGKASRLVQRFPEAEDGLTPGISSLCPTAQRIFEAKGIARGALAALTLFCEAARQEAATVELVQRAIGEVERAQRSGRASTE